MSQKAEFSEKENFKTCVQFMRKDGSIVLTTMANRLTVEDLKESHEVLAENRMGFIFKAETRRR